jgi:hypothetical protein
VHVHGYVAAGQAIAGLQVLPDGSTPADQGLCFCCTGAVVGVLQQVVMHFCILLCFTHP